MADEAFPPGDMGGEIEFEKKLPDTCDDRFSGEGVLDLEMR